MAFLEETWDNCVYEHHLLAALPLTECKLHPISSKIAAPLHNVRASPSFREYFLDKQLGRGQQGLLNNPAICPKSPRL